MSTHGAESLADSDVDEPDNKRAAEHERDMLTSARPIRQHEIDEELAFMSGPTFHGWTYDELVAEAKLAILRRAGEAEAEEVSSILKLAVLLSVSIPLDCDRFVYIIEITFVANLKAS